MRTSIIFLLLLTFTQGIQAQKHRTWASARERGLTGVVHIVISKCSDISGNHEIRYKYEYALDGKLIVIESPQLNSPIVSGSLSHKITGRNNRGDIEEVSFFIGDALERKEKYKYEYDSVGNWIKRVTFVMREYEVVGGSWKAGEWQAKYVCSRTIEYYPSVGLLTATEIASRTQENVPESFQKG